MFKKQKDSPQERKFQTLEIEVEKEQAGIEPKKFMFWMFMGTVTLLFTGLMAAFLIKRGMGTWVNLILPWEFYLSTLAILCSSYFMHKSYLLAKSDDFDILPKYLYATFLLGLTFTVLQLFAWKELYSQGLSIQYASSFAFLYFLSGLHALHILGGLVFLYILIKKAKNLQIHSKSTRSIELCTTYWHFVDGVWVFLFLFLLIFR